ncbi:hypothetical protein D3C81_1849580 [compost metagenome]
MHGLTVNRLRQIEKQHRQLQAGPGLGRRQSGGAILQGLREGDLGLQQAFSQLRNDVGGVAEHLTRLMHVEYRHATVRRRQLLHQLIKGFKLFDGRRIA